MPDTHESLARIPPPLEAFTRADKPDLERLYLSLLERLKRVEPELRCFTSGPPDPERVMARVAALTRAPSRTPRPRPPPVRRAPWASRDIIRVRGQANRLRPRCCRRTCFAGPEAACVHGPARSGRRRPGPHLEHGNSPIFEPGPTANPHRTDPHPGRLQQRLGRGRGRRGPAPGPWAPRPIGLHHPPRPPIAAWWATSPRRGRIPRQGLIFFSPSADRNRAVSVPFPTTWTRSWAGAFGPWNRAATPNRPRLGPARGDPAWTRPLPDHRGTAAAGA